MTARIDYHPNGTKVITTTTPGQVTIELCEIRDHAPPLITYMDLPVVEARQLAYDLLLACEYKDGRVSAGLR